VARKMIKDRLFVELTEKNGDAFWDAKIPQATIDVKRIQVMLERISHGSYTDSPRAFDSVDKRRSCQRHGNYFST